jgi:hypothetical protein
MLVVWLIFVCAVVRIVPHPPNFAPVGATAVLAGRTLRPGAAIAVTLAAMALSDLALAAIHGWRPFGLGSLFVYAGFTCQVLIARGLRRRRGGAIAAALLGAGAFFVLSNLGVWLLGTLYPRDLTGLTACYLAALPFFAATVVGDVLWTVALSLGWRALARRLGPDRFWVPAGSLEARAL